MNDNQLIALIEHLEAARDILGSCDEFNAKHTWLVDETADFEAMLESRMRSKYQTFERFVRDQTRI